jgi:hypothetical protein
LVPKSFFITRSSLELDFSDWPQDNIIDVQKKITISFFILNSFLHFALALLHFDKTQRFFEWVPDSTFVCKIYKILVKNYQNCPLKVPLIVYYLHLPITFSGLAKGAIFTTNTDAEH